MLQLLRSFSISVKEPKAEESLLPNGVDGGSWKRMLKCAVGSSGPVLLTESNTVGSQKGFLCRLKVAHSFEESGNQPTSFPTPVLPKGLTQNSIPGAERRVKLKRGFLCGN